VSFFAKTRIGSIVKITGGVLRDKYAMIVGVFPKTKTADAGVAVIVDPSDWPAEVPSAFNAIYVLEERVLELTKEEQALLKLKFPNPDQFEE